jgi:hypothetical protein
MPPLKHRYLYLLFIFALLTGAWAGRTQLTELVITSSMHGLGLNNITTDIHQLGLNNSHINSIKFSLLTETGLFQLEAHDISMDYRLEQLSEGRVENITVNKLALHYESTQNTHDDSQAIRSTLEPLKIIAALRHALREYVIFNKFSVEHIVLNGESFAALQGKPLQLSGTNHEGTVFVEFTLLDQVKPNLNQNLRQLVITNLSQDSITVELRLTGTVDSTPASLELNIHDTDINGSYHIIPKQLTEWLQPLTNISSFEEIEVVNGGITLNLESESIITSILTATTDKLTYGSYDANHIDIKIKLETTAANPFQITKLQNGSYVKAGKFSYEDFSVGEARLNLVGDLATSTSQWQYNGGISSERLELNYNTQTLQLKDITARISANTNSLNIEGDFSPAILPGKFMFTLDHNLTQGQGQVSVKPIKAINLNAENNRLSQLLTPWPYPFDLLTGEINFTSNGAWSQTKKFRLRSRLKLDKAGGHYGEILFSGLSLDHEIEILPKLHSIRTGKTSLMHLDSGVTASNIVTMHRFEPSTTGPLPQMAVQGLHGEIFGGTFSGNDFIFDLNNKRNSFKIRATNIDLAEIVETQQLEDITVTGRIDGTIPVEINEKGVLIEHGAFINDIRAGTIRYNPAAGTDQLKQNPITGIALDALKDFRYSHLSADVNFTPEGMLTINLQLKGTSPELDTKRPVHLNINTEQNLLSLLKSLRFAEGVSESIDQKVRRQYEK